MFAPGDRPAAAAVRTALTRAGVGHVSYDPAGTASGAAASDWLELLVDGLTFDVLGLAPGQSLVMPEPRHRIGLPASPPPGYEAIGIAPGPHLSGAGNTMPVLRTLLRLGTALIRGCEGAAGTLWLPAGSATGRADILDMVDGWLAGGAFPVLGLTGVVALFGGVLASDGLEFFTGQEVELDAALCADRVAGTRLVVRLIDRLVESGRLHAECSLQLEGDGLLRLVPEGSVIRVSAGP